MEGTSETNISRGEFKLRKFMQVASLISEFSTCEKNKVGAIILSDNRIIATGYNGTFSNRSNCCEDENGNTLSTTIHAEANAILFAAKNGIAVDGCVMLTTCMPCIECAKMIIQSGIQKVYYMERYRHGNGMDCLLENGIEVSQIK